MIDGALPGMAPDAMSSLAFLGRLVVVCLACFAFACSDDGEKPDGGPDDGPSLEAALTARFPAPGSSTCADTSLRMTFTTEPTVGTSGKIQVFDADAPDMPAVEIDVGATYWRGILATKPFMLGKPVFVDGTSVVVYLAGPVLAPNHTYFVKVDPGVFLDAEGNSLGGISDPEAWRFTTVAP
ncbi:MAG TPA: Ig-like domain-containing protein, partial [Polyangiaceae bacterium]|nr:Ig-like domain-containing protein [Polyangiaceae bacterium]